jgi:hypothetical protein
MHHCGVGTLAVPKTSATSMAKFYVVDQCKKNYDVPNFICNPKNVSGCRSLNFVAMWRDGEPNMRQVL